MATGRIKWDETSKHFYETGVSNCALYVKSGDTYGTGVAWNGISSIEEAPEGADANAIYADNIKYLNLIAAEDFKATVEAYTYPEEFEVCDGSASLVTGATIGQQSRATFGLAYKTKVGNENDSELGYKLHVIYGCTAAPSSKSYETVNDSPEAISFSWEISTVPVTFTYDNKSYTTATITVDSRQFTGDDGKAKLKAFEDKLFGVDAADGTTASDPTLPADPSELLKLLA